MIHTVVGIYGQATEVQNAVKRLMHNGVSQQDIQWYDEQEPVEPVRAVWAGYTFSPA